MAHYKVDLKVGPYTLEKLTFWSNYGDMGPLAISNKKWADEILFHLATKNGGLVQMMFLFNWVIF